MNVRLAAVFLVPLCFFTVVADAHSVALKLGAFAPRIDSDLWEENLATFTIERSDFDALIGGVEVSIELSELVDLAFGVETSSSTVFSNYRGFVFEDGSEILQDLTLRTTPVTAGVRVFPIGKLRRVFPYVTGGAGLICFSTRRSRLCLKSNRRKPLGSPATSMLVSTTILGLPSGAGLQPPPPPLWPLGGAEPVGQSGKWRTV